MKTSALGVAAIAVGLLLSGCGSDPTPLEENMSTVGLDPEDYGDVEDTGDANESHLCARPINANFLAGLVARPDLDSKLFMVAIAKTRCPTEAGLIVEQVALEDPAAADRLESAGWR